MLDDRLWAWRRGRSPSPPQLLAWESCECPPLFVKVDNQKDTVPGSQDKLQKLRLGSSRAESRR